MAECQNGFTLPNVVTVVLSNVVESTPFDFLTTSEYGAQDNQRFAGGKPESSWLFCEGGDVEGGGKIKASLPAVYARENK